MRRHPRDPHDDPPRRKPERSKPGPRPTLIQMHRSSSWLWVNCENRPNCEHRAPMTLVPLMIRWGADTSSDKLRRAARCMKCGNKGATLQHPSYIDRVLAYGPFPARH